MAQGDRLPEKENIAGACARNMEKGHILKSYVHIQSSAGIFEI